ncbi:MAG: hypothetical protein MUF72_15025 [Elainella sp. Prado103]|jgi:outer membrane murein-binding lipoprotein Lpp|nr:hypothetical protein [Elainella sp. Prado103]
MGHHLKKKLNQLISIVEHLAMQAHQIGGQMQQINERLDRTCNTLEQLASSIPANPADPDPLTSNASTHWDLQLNQLAAAVQSLNYRVSELEQQLLSAKVPLSADSISQGSASEETMAEDSTEMAEPGITATATPDTAPTATATATPTIVTSEISVSEISVAISSPYSGVDPDWEEDEIEDEPDEILWDFLEPEQRLG